MYTLSLCILSRRSLMCAAIWLHTISHWNGWRHTCFSVYLTFRPVEYLTDTGETFKHNQRGGEMEHIARRQNDSNLNVSQIRTHISVSVLVFGRCCSDSYDCLLNDHCQLESIAVRLFLLMFSNSNVDVNVLKSFDCLNVQAQIFTNGFLSCAAII